MTVFDKICDLVKQLDEESFRILFWNSDNKEQNIFFKTGVSILPFVVKKSTITQSFTYVKGPAHGGKSCFYMFVCTENACILADV